MFVVTHLLGSGHLSRILTLARGFQAAGHAPVIISGGMPVPHLTTPNDAVIQLPPLRSDGVDFTRLLGPDGTVADADYHATRQKLMLEALVEHAPDVIITELFPFGRRSLRAEFIALLNASKSVTHIPVVLASIRDILAPPSKPAKTAFAQSLVADYYDAVLVHSDPKIAPLELSWPVNAALQAKLRYTGFVAPPAAGPHPTQEGAGEVIVSAGGGDVGAQLFQTAKAAAARDPSRKWRILVSGENAQERISELAQNAPQNLTIEAARPDFRQLLHHAAASVSMCGYNTVQDILQTKCPAVFTPFDAGNEVEQTIRAHALQALNGIEVLKTSDLSATALLKAIEATIAAPKRADMAAANGISTAVQIAESLCEATS